MANNIRDKVLADVKAGMSAADAAKKHEQKTATVRQWIKRYLNNGSVTRDKNVTKSKSVTKKCDSVTKSSVTTHKPVENLIPFNQRSKDEAREFGKKGGIASGIARREKKTAREVAQMILAGNIESIAPDSAFALLDTMGIETTDMNVQAAILASQAKAAFEGNYKAAEFIFAMAGEKPSDKISIDADINTTFHDPYEELTTEELRRLAAMADDDDG